MTKLYEIFDIGEPKTMENKSHLNLNVKYKKQSIVFQKSILGFSNW